MLWHNIIGRLLKPSVPSEICPPFYSWDLDTTLLRTRGNSAANQRSYIELESLTSKPPLYYLSQQSAVYYQPGMSDFRNIVEFCVSAQLNETLRFSLSPCPPAVPISGLLLETLNCNIKAPSQNLIYAKL